ncbi:MAG: dihydrolipoyl dehydrogenase family protein, partial [Bdellovibrionales bacterium]
PIGCEMAQSFSRLGSKVTLVEKGSRLLASEIKEASAVIEKSLTVDGVTLHLNSEIIEFPDSKSALVKSKDQIRSLTFDCVLFAIGRKPRTTGFGLENLQISLTGKGTVEHNEFMQTQFPNIYVCGDVAGPYQLTHVAGHQAWYASVNALFGQFKMFKQDLRVIPRCPFPSQEVASVGFREEQARALGIDADVTYYPMEDFDRAICDQETQGFIQLVTKKNSDRLLGVTIVNARAGELLTEYTLAMRWNLGLKKILSTVHAYPTWSDANKLAALEWQRKNIPHELLSWVEKYFSWVRN